jgi:hypothetical protein
MFVSLSSTPISAANSVGARQGARPSAEEVFKKLDTDSKGYLTQDDLVKISPEASQAADAAAAFTKMDADADGRVSQAEFKAAEPGHGPNPGASGRPPAGGKPGGQGGPPPSGAASSQGSAKTYEAADANEDGKVTQPEQLAYDAKQALKAYSAVAKATD